MTKPASKKPAATRTPRKPAPAASSKPPPVPAKLEGPSPTAKPEPKKGAAKREVTPGDAKITVLAKENPRRAGTLGARTFALYKTGMTVGEWREKVKAADCDPGYLHADIRAGFIAVK